MLFEEPLSDVESITVLMHVNEIFIRRTLSVSLDHPIAELSSLELEAASL